LALEVADDIKKTEEMSTELATLQ